MSPKTRDLRHALQEELQRLQSVTELAVVSANHLTGLTLDPDTARPDLVSESTVVKEIATLLQHAAQNLAHRIGPGAAGAPARVQRRKAGCGSTRLPEPPAGRAT